jgi:hypothetical protein
MWRIRISESTSFVQENSTKGLFKMVFRIWLKLIFMSTARLSNKYSFSERLDQGHLHPLLKVLNLTRASAVGGEHSSKELSSSVLIAIRNIYIWARHGSPRYIHDHTWTALGCRLKSTCKSFNPDYWHQALASVNFQWQARQITSGSPLCRDLTKVISILYYRSWD